MDDVTTRLRAEKARGPSAAEIAEHAASLSRLSDDLETFLETASAGCTIGDAGVRRPISRSACPGPDTTYRPYDAADALTRRSR